MQVVINGEELRKALDSIEKAEKNGFQYCLAVLSLVNAGPSIEHCRVEYSDMIEKAHPTDDELDWGRFQSVTERFKFRNGKLVPIRDRSKTNRKG
jgi:hypothetical protein